MAKLWIGNKLYSVENEVQDYTEELEGKLKWHKEEKLRLEKEIHTLREREYCDDCSAKTILPEPHGISCKAKERIKELETENDKFEGDLLRIDTWAKAYPLDVFLKPDLKQAAKVLKTAGMTLDAISADAMRHVLDGVKDIVEQALKGK